MSDKQKPSLKQSKNRYNINIIIIKTIYNGSFLLNRKIIYVTFFILTIVDYEILFELRLKCKKKTIYNLYCNK